MFAGYSGVRGAVVFMKVVVLGGSAHSTPALWSYLVNEARLEGLEVVLAGRNKERLNAVVRACTLSGNDRNRLTSTVISSELDWRVLEKADVVLIQIRSGGYLARACDETFPLKYGVVGDEGLGPGGLCAAIRNWQAIEPALERTSRLAPNAFVVMMSSPVGLLVRAAACRFPHLSVAGICELPWTTLVDTCHTLGVDPAQVRFDYFGVNHLGWLYGITHNGHPLAAIVPLKYLRLHEQKNAVLAEQRQVPKTRAIELDEISREAFRVYSKAGEEHVRRASGMRATPWYRHAVGPLIASFTGKKIQTILFLSVRNDGFDSWQRKDDILEYAHTVDGRTFHRVPRTMPVPVEMRQTIAPFVEYERVATQGVLHADAQVLEESLRLHPWLNGCQKIQEMTREILNYAHAA